MMQRSEREHFRSSVTSLQIYLIHLYDCSATVKDPFGVAGMAILQVSVGKTFFSLETM
jgi:hypothetical protein